MKPHRIAAQIVIGVVLTSLACSVGARFMGRPTLVVPLGVPAMLLTGWAFVGHLITLDDDAPGGWSNPERFPKLWRQSLSTLAILLAVFGVTCWMVAFWTYRRI